VRNERLGLLESGEISIRLIKRRIAEKDYLNIYCKDSGAGFDYSQFKMGDAASGLRHGRGILLMATLCNFIEYSGNGSEVTARLAV